jgi:hypothetical protein
MTSRQVNNSFSKDKTPDSAKKKPSKESGSKNLASDLAQEALKRGTTDNVSVIIIEIKV